MGDDARIWIGGLPDGIEEQEIKDEYERFGEIKHVHIRCNKGSPAFCFVQFLDRRNAEDAVKSTDQAKLFGMPFVKVSWAGKGAPRKGKGKGNRSRTPPGHQSDSPRRGPPTRRDSRPRSPPPQRRDDSRPRGGGGRARSPPPRARVRADSRHRPARSPPPRRGDSRGPQRARSDGPPRREREPSPAQNGSRRDYRHEERAPAERRRSSASPRRAASYRHRSPSPRGGGYGDRDRDRSPPSRREERSRTPQPQRGGRQPKPSELQGKYRVKIEKLPEDMGWQELKGLGVTFAKHGQCTFARTLRDRSGVLEFTSIHDMERAIDELDGRRFSGSETRVIAYEDKSQRR